MHSVQADVSCMLNYTHTSWGKKESTLHAIKLWPSVIRIHGTEFALIRRTFFLLEMKSNVPDIFHMDHGDWRLETGNWRLTWSDFIQKEMTWRKSGTHAMSDLNYFFSIHLLWRKLKLKAGLWNRIQFWRLLCRHWRGMLLSIDSFDWWLMLGSAKCFAMSLVEVSLKEESNKCCSHSSIIDENTWGKMETLIHLNWKGEIIL